MTEKASLNGPLAKLGRAKNHLETLYGEYNRSVGPETHVLTAYDGEKPRTQVWKVEGLADLPADWGLVVGDFAHNLRSALDHLVWQLVLLCGAKPSRDNQFPICTTRSGYWLCKSNGAPSTRDYRLRGVADEYRTPIDVVQPYHAGDDPKATFLAALNDLSNFDKHQVIQAAHRFTLEPRQEDFQLHSVDEHAFVRVTRTPWQRLEDGAEVMETEIVTSDPDAKVQLKANLPVAVAFGKARVSMEGLGPLYELVRDFIESYARAFCGERVAPNLKGNTRSPQRPVGGP